LNAVSPAAAVASWLIARAIPFAGFATTLAEKRAHVFCSAATFIISFI
jgi:hypothetical protein